MIGHENRQCLAVGNAERDMKMEQEREWETINIKGNVKIEETIPLKERKEKSQKLNLGPPASLSTRKKRR